MAVDGYLNFDTKINTKGFKKDLGDISKGANQAADEVKELNSELDKPKKVEISAETEKSKSELEELEEKIAKAENRLEKYKDKAASIKASADPGALDEDSENADFSSISALDELNRKIDNGYARLEKLKTKLADLSAEPHNIDVDVNADTSDISQEVMNAAEQAEASADDVDIKVSVRNLEESEKGVEKACEKIKDTADDTSESVKDSFADAGSSVANSFEALSGNLVGVLKKLIATAAVAFSVKQVIAFGKQALESSAEVNAANSQLTQTFGELQSAAEAAMGRVAETSGIVQTRLQGVGTSIYAFAKASGMESAEALGMMEEALQVTADSAAYYDRSLEDTAESLKSFLKGNYANDAALGISCTETTRNAAANKLYAKSFSELSEAQKQLVLLQMVKDANDLSGATGQAAREADGWENVLGNLKEAWKQLLAVIGQPILSVTVSVIKQITSALQSLTKTVSSVVQSFSEAFGIELMNASAVSQLADSSAASAQSSQEAADCYSDMAQSAEDAAKANENSLAGFDKINKLSSGTGADESSSGGSSDVSAAVPDIVVPVDTDTSEASKQFEKFIKYMRSATKKLTSWTKKTFGGSWAQTWDGLKNESWELYETLKVIFGDIKSLGTPLAEFFSGDFTILLSTAFDVLGEIAVGLFDSFNKVFSDLWRIAVFPFLQNLVTTGLPMLAQFRTQGILTFGTVFSSVKQIFDTLWSECICPILGFITQMWCGMVTTLSEFWNKWGVPIFDGIREAIEGTKDTILNFWEVAVKPVFDAIMEVLSELWTNHIQPLVAGILDCIGELISGALDIYNKFILPIVNWFVNTLYPPIAKILSQIVKTIGGVVGNIIDYVSGVIRSLKGIIQFVTGVFTGDWKKAWEGIKNIFGGAWDALVSLAKIPINLIIDSINGLTQAVESAINWVIDGINSISIDLPDVVADFVGFDSLGFNLSNIDIPEIPHLAQGMVIPANYGEFLAVLGDNKRESEVVSPVSAIEKAMENVLDRRSDSSGGDINLTVNLDGKTVYKTVVKKNNESIRMTGKNPLVPV